MTSTTPPMRSASEIVESITREVVDGVGFTLDDIERRAMEFERVAGKAPSRTLQHDLALAVARQLERLGTSLAMQRFRL